MKRIIYLLVPVLVALTVLSCKRDYDDDYMGNVDERLDAMLSSYEKTLVSSEHGWMANITTANGIYRFWMKFYKNNGSDLNDLKGNRVIMISDNLQYDFSGYHEDEEGEVTITDPIADTSSFRLKALQRPTLIFDTYSYLSIICDPDNGVSGGSNNQGLETDFEYEIASYEGGKFTLVGRTHRVPATLEMATAEEEANVKSADMVRMIKHLSDYVHADNHFFQYIETENYGPVMIDFGQRLMGAYYEAPDGKSLIHSDYSTSYMSFGKDVMLTTPIAVAEGIVIEKLSWTGSQYEAVLTNGQRFPVIAKDDSPIPLSAWMGPEYNREYNSFYLPVTWLDALYSPDSPVLAGFKRFAAGVQAYNPNFTPYDFLMRFQKNADGTDYFELEHAFVYRGSLWSIVYNFDMVWVKDGVFRLGNYTCPFDANDFNTYFLQKGFSKPLLDMLAGQTYGMDWAGLLQYDKVTRLPIGFFQSLYNTDVVVLGNLQSVRE